MPRPEGYRKALRMMETAERFKLPILTFIDTPGAYPGIDAEERGQSEAIARNLREMAGLRTPIIATVIGEGGSGGALAIGVADKLMMLQYATYSVISPEGCASILWKSADKASQAAEAMAITSDKLMELALIDGIVPEPLGERTVIRMPWPPISNRPCYSPLSSCRKIPGRTARQPLQASDVLRSVQRITTGR